jgi:hypothetical protein
LTEADTLYLATQGGELRLGKPTFMAKFFYVYILQSEAASENRVAHH